MPRGGLPIQFRPRVVMVAKTLFGQAQYTTIQAAINYAVTQTPSATAPWVVEIFPGVYTEQVTMAAFVDIKGVGAAEDTILRQADGTIIILASNSTIEDVTIDLNAQTTGRNLIIDNAVAVSNSVIRNCRFTITTPATNNNHIFQLTAASQVVIDGTRTLDAGIGGSGINIMVYNDTAGATVTLINNVWVHNNNNAYHLASSVAGTWKSTGNAFRGNGRVTNAWSLGTYLGSGNSYRTTGTTQFANISGGSFTEKSGPGKYEVYTGMLVQHAIAAAIADTPAPAAASPYNIMFYGGTSTEAIASAAYVNVVPVWSIPSADRNEFIAKILNICGQTEIFFLPTLTETTTSTEVSRNARVFTYDATIATRLSLLGKGAAVDFNGTTGEADTPDADALSFGNSAVDNPHSVLVLCKPDGNAALMTLFAKAASAADQEWELFLDASGHLNYQLQDESVDTYLEARYAAAVGTAWTLLGATYDGSQGIGGIKIYTNGVSRAVTNDSSGAYVALENGAGLVHLGARFTIKEQFFDGKIAMALLPAKALSPDEMHEIKTLVNSYFDLAL